jgi:hypothetical protein
MLLLTATFSARAIDSSDVYYIPEESGWGIFLVQSDTFQFLSFYVYGPDGKPTWYTAELDAEGPSKYSGPLYATTGTYFAEAWDPAKHAATVVGTASFTPIDTYSATLVYTVNGVPPVTKTVRRQTLTSYPMGGNYSGSVVGAISGCAEAPDNDPSVHARFNLTVAQAGEDSATLDFTYVDPDHAGVSCSISGALVHIGRLYRMTGARYTCNAGTGDPLESLEATVDALHPTGQGIEGRYTAPVGEGCVHSFRFAAVRR